jgi:hypothetical protein
MDRAHIDKRHSTDVQTDDFIVNPTQDSIAIKKTARHREKRTHKTAKCHSLTVSVPNRKKRGTSTTLLMMM